MFIIKPEIFLQPYIKEILTNARWTLSLIEQGSHYNFFEFERVKYNSLAVNTADSIAQLACFTTAKGKNKVQAYQRLQALENCYPGIPQAPVSAKKIRNTIHHFDERMDDWLFGEMMENDGSYSSVMDSSGNLEGFGTSGSYNLERRMLNDNELLYWDEIIKIDELKKWCEDIVLHFADAQL